MTALHSDHFEGDSSVRLQSLVGIIMSCEWEREMIEEVCHVIRWVNMFLYDMRSRGVGMVTLNESEPLPLVPDPRGGECVAPEFSKVMNRLKIMSGLNPIRCQEPVQGTVEVTMGAELHIVTISFDETRESASCNIEIRKKSDSQQKVP